MSAMLLPFGPADEAAVRAQVRAALQATIPPEHVDMIVDLAVHAVQSALVSLESVCSRSADPRHFLAAISPAVGLLAARCQLIEAGLVEYAKANGLTHTTGRVKVGGGQ